MPEIPIDHPMVAPWVARATDRMVAITRGGERITDIGEIDHAVRFLSMLEIDAGIPDPEVRLTRNGRIICMWTNGDVRLAILICAPEDKPKDRRYECFARYGRVKGQPYANQSVICYPVQVRHALARLFPVLEARWVLP